MLASTCGLCHRPGVASTDQLNNGGVKSALKGVRFWCVCGHVWIANGHDVEQHTRWLSKVGLA